MTSSDQVSDIRFEGEVYHGYNELGNDYFTPEEIDQLKHSKLVEDSHKGCLRLTEHGEDVLFDGSFEPNHYELYFLWRFRHLSLTAIIETKSGERVARQLNGCNQLLALDLPCNSNIFLHESTKEERDQQLNLIRTPEDLISWLLDYNCVGIIECYSTPVYEKRKFEETEFIKRFSDVRLTLLVDDSDYESGYQKVTPYSMDAIAMIEFLREGEYTNDLSLEEFQDLADLQRGLLDTSRWAIACIPTEEWEKEQANKERQEYEHIAAEIAQRHNCKPYSLEFLDAIEAEKSHWQDRKYSLREDGLCAGDGTISGWYDLNDGYSENSDNLTNLQSWIEKNLPLLWAQWQETAIASTHSV